MIIVPTPRRFLRATAWQQTDQRRSLQRSEWTGRTRETVIGPADRWTCAADVRRFATADLPTWRAFQARMKQPGSACRVPVAPVSQYGAADNFILNPELAGSAAPWQLSAGWSRIETGAPPDFPSMGLYTDSTRAFGNAFANDGIGVPIAAGQALQLSCDVFRSSDSAGTLALVANFMNAGGSLITSLGLNLLTAATANLWQRARGAVTAPAGTVAAIIYFNHGLTAGFASVTGVRASLRPERALVAAGSTPVALNLRSLVPNATNLLAGQLLTVPLPSGDEQLAALTENLVAGGAGTATAQIGNPLRELPALDAPVEMARPWALMRASDPLAWSVEPGGIHGAQQLQLEEWF